MDVLRETLDGGEVIRFQLKDKAGLLSYSDVLLLWKTSPEFRAEFNSILASSPFAAFRWETPPVTSSSSRRIFEFVLIDTPEFNSRQPDSEAFKEFFTSDEETQGVVVFPNLGKDAILIVPEPRTSVAAYGHLASFVRDAPAQQSDAFWKVVGETVSRQLDESPMWINTAGGGIAWLHLRVDSRPKYYAYKAYVSQA